MAFTDPTVNNSAIDYGGLITGINNAAGGWLGFGILLTLFVVIFISFKAYSSAKAFASAMFLMLILSLMMAGMNLVSYMMVGIVAILLALSFIAASIESSSSVL